MRLLRAVKDLKEQGFQLKAIKKLLPDLDALKDMDPKVVCQLREELNRQVLQERNYELSRISSGVSANYKHRESSMDRLHQFEVMMSQMIRGTMEEMSRESEKRICDQVNVKLQKEMNYLLLQKEELHERQMLLLQEILSQIKKEENEQSMPLEAAATLENKKKTDTPEKGLPQRNGREKRRKKKLFAKSVS
jgi:hypothetical protein